MLKVYRISTDVGQYQYFLPDGEENAMALITNGLPQTSTWNPPNVYIYKPLHKKGDFWSFVDGTLITSPKATHQLLLHFEHAGEILPLPYNDEVYSVINVTECINCLDQENTQWRYGGKNNVKLDIKKYAFHKDRFSESDIFKIPETCESEILVVGGRKDPEDEFKYAVEALGLKGLIFELIWEE